MAQIGVLRHSRTRSRHIIGTGFVKRTKYAIAASFAVLTVVLFLVATYGRTASVPSGPENKDSSSGIGSGESGTAKAFQKLRVGNLENDYNSIPLGNDAASDAVKAAKAAVAAARAAFDAVKEEDDNYAVVDSTVNSVQQTT